MADGRKEELDLCEECGSPLQDGFCASCGGGFHDGASPVGSAPLDRSDLSKVLAEACRHPCPRLVRTLHAAGRGDGAAQETDRAAGGAVRRVPRGQGSREAERGTPRSQDHARNGAYKGCDRLRRPGVSQAGEEPCRGERVHRERAPEDRPAEGPRCGGVFSTRQ